MKHFILISLLGLSFNVIGATKFIKAQGKFLSQEEDSLEFTKKQLIFEAFINSISLKLDELGLDKKLFWQKYDDKLNSEFESLDTRLKKQYNISEKSSERVMKKYKDSLRLKKLIIRRKMGNLRSVVQSYVVKKLSRSAHNKYLRLIKLEVKLNEKKLTKIFFRFTRGKVESAFGSLYLKTDFYLNDITYSDMGISNEKDFTGVILNNWLDWFSKNKTANISDIQLLSEGERTQLENFSKQPRTERFYNTPGDFEDSLLLAIKVKISKKSFNPELQKYEFGYSASAYLKDIRTSIVVKTYNFGNVVKNYRIEEGMSLVNIVANHVYRMVSSNFSQVNKSIKDFPPVSNMASLKFLNINSSEQVMSLLQLFKERGVRYSLRSELSQVGQNSAEAELFFDGELVDIKSLLSKLKSAKKALSFELIAMDKGFGIKLK